MIADHFWRGLGLVSTGLGLVGAALPLVPTTPFLLVAAYAFARSSPRLNDWLLHHPQFGPLIINWRRHRAISRHVKLISMVLMGSMVIAGWLVGMSSLVVTAQAMCLGCVALFILTRPDAPSSPESKADPAPGVPSPATQARQRSDPDQKKASHARGAWD